MKKYVKGRDVNFNNCRTKLNLTREKTMTLRIKDRAPNFQTEKTHGKIDFLKLIGDGWEAIKSYLRKVHQPGQ